MCQKKLTNCLAGDRTVKQQSRVHAKCACIEIKKMHPSFPCDAVRERERESGFFLIHFPDFSLYFTPVK